MSISLVVVGVERRVLSLLLSLGMCVARIDWHGQSNVRLWTDRRSHWKATAWQNVAVSNSSNLVVWLYQGIRDRVNKQFLCRWGVIRCVMAGRILQRRKLSSARRVVLVRLLYSHLWWIDLPHDGQRWCWSRRINKIKFYSLQLTSSSDKSKKCCNDERQLSRMFWHSMLTMAISSNQRSFAPSIIIDDGVMALADKVHSRIKNMVFFHPIDNNNRKNMLSWLSANKKHPRESNQDTRIIPGQLSWYMDMA